MKITSDLILEAYGLIQSEIIETPLVESNYINNGSRNNVLLKLENQQNSGSFKIRGVANAFRTILKNNETTIVAASTGNHAAAVLYKCKQHGLESMLFVPKSVIDAKLSAMQGASDIKLIGDQCGETELIAKEWAKERGLPFIHPYNDADVVIGQGSIGPEIANQLDLNDVESVYVPIGGGGLISGLGTYIKSVYPKIKIIGCQPEAAPEMYQSLKEGKIVEPINKVTISDATAGGINPKSITFPICQRVVDKVMLLSETEIAEAVYLLYKYENALVEPSAALAYAAVLKSQKNNEGEKSIALVTGSKISTKIFEQIKKRYQ